MYNCCSRHNDNYLINYSANIIDPQVFYTNLLPRACVSQQIVSGRKKGKIKILRTYIRKIRSSAENPRRRFKVVLFFLQLLQTHFFVRGSPACSLRTKKYYDDPMYHATRPYALYYTPPRRSANIYI